MLIGESEFEARVICEKWGSYRDEVQESRELREPSMTTTRIISIQMGK